ncbi:LOW QUALITY PROTEIN: olfactory receptor 51F1-like [Mustela putorius furo]|uniref:LOW QUALITY PROTEIN: olfactory receptor 51F1-like n=1 Tax=Mustela putorius furo TaxID=9669 RepID=A0A8U0NNY3_MUSPF|nr:LOW QUALITY PROTEIN: olfactory receptor 51F1-like [Mustela putorius furo]
MATLGKVRGLPRQHSTTSQIKPATSSPKTYCEHVALLKLANADTRPYLWDLTASMVGLDRLVVTTPCVMILIGSEDTPAYLQAAMGIAERIQHVGAQNVLKASDTSCSPASCPLITPTFFLTGVPGLEDFHIWFSILFCCLCGVALLGNSTILCVVITDSSLHEPMYYFLSMLSNTDLGITISSFPTTLSIPWFNARIISQEDSIVQMFFLPRFTLMESSVLLAMAFDCLTSICKTLRYAMVLTNSRTIKAGLLIFVQMLVYLMPLLLLLKQLSFCGPNVLSQSYCYQPDVIKCSCSSIKINSIRGFVVLIPTSDINIPSIFLSNVLNIIKSIPSIASPEERQKAFGTCVSRVGALVIFYIPWIILALVHRFGHNAPPYVHILM